MGKHEFKIVGSRFSTDPLRVRSGSDESRGPVKVVWDGGKSWRLRSLVEGQASLNLVGIEKYLTWDWVREKVGENRLFIILGGWMSGLSSFHNWLLATSGELQVITLDLDWVQRAGSNPSGRLEKAAGRVVEEIRLLTDSKKLSGKELQHAEGKSDPIDIIEAIARTHSGTVGAIVFRDFDALDLDTKKSLFGRLRRLYDREDQPLAKLPVFLLGHRFHALDPHGTEPGSNLLPFSCLFTLDTLTEKEVAAMAEKLPKSDVDLRGVMGWSGGHPLLVQALFRQIESDPLTPSVKEAIAFLEQNRLPAFETWVSKLIELIDEHEEISRIIRVMLKGDHGQQFPMRLVNSRFAVAELLIKGWIKIDDTQTQSPQDQELVWRSDLHRKLADDANVQRRR